MHLEKQELTYSEQEEQKKGKVKKQTLVATYQLIRKARIPKLLLLLSIILSLGGALLGLFVPLQTGHLIDVIGQGTIDWWLILTLLGLFLAENLLGSVSWYLLAYIGQQVLYNIREKLWKQVLALPVLFFDKYRSAETMSRVTNDTNEINLLFSNHLVTLAANMITVLGGIFLLFRIDWQMAMIILLAVPLGILAITPIGGKMYQISIDLYSKLAELTTVLTQTISEIRLVKASNAEKQEEQNGLSNMKQLLQFGLKEAKINAILQPLMSTIMLSMLVLVIGYGGVRVASGAITAGELVSFILLIFQIIWPLSSFTGFYTQLQKVMGAVERLTVILDHPSEHQTTRNKTLHANQDLIFKNLSFSYVQNKPVLENLNFTIPKGKVTAIVGPSGSGKTTLFSLIEQFYLPTTGEILYGEEAIKQLDLTKWREKIGYVSQESSLVDGTIQNNICYGQTKTFTKEQIERAAKMAYAHSFIEDSSEGYKTRVGERGMQLSGGQRQRIAIARAFLREPEILLLDEATASLDSESEQKIQQALDKLMHQRTTLIIAHRLSTVVEADQIIVLEKGKITGVGTHNELLEHPSYANWVAKQFHTQS